MLAHAALSTTTVVARQHEFTNSFCESFSKRNPHRIAVQVIKNVQQLALSKYQPSRINHLSDLQPLICSAFVCNSVVVSIGQSCHVTSFTMEDLCKFNIIQHFYFYLFIYSLIRALGYICLILCQVCPLLFCWLNDDG